MQLDDTYLRAIPLDHRELNVNRESHIASGVELIPQVLFRGYPKLDAAGASCVKGQEVMSASDLALGDRFVLLMS